jgi:hypothetical protein
MHRRPKQKDTGTGDAASAWLDVAKAKGQERAQQIRDRTMARKAIFAAASKAAAVRASKNPELLDRMVDRLVSEQLEWQENREAIAAETVKLLAESPPAADTQGPSKD